MNENCDAFDIIRHAEVGHQFILGFATQNLYGNHT